MCECIQVNGVVSPSKGCKECFPNKPHKHAELIKLWADGAKIQYNTSITQTPNWVDCLPEWKEWVEYRVKPTPKPDIHTFARVYRVNNASGFGFTKQEDANVKFVFDGETEKLKEVIVL